MYIAHKREDTGEVQALQAHCEETAALARAFAIEPLRELAKAIGVLHDVGKYQPSFQKRIGGDASIRAPHAMCGAQTARERYAAGPAALLAAYVVAGHHAGLPDYGSNGDATDDPTLCANLRRSAEDYSAYAAELRLPEVDQRALAAFLMRDCASQDDLAEKYAFITRYCFSCLTDADSLNTEAFCEGRERDALKADFEACLAKVNARLGGYVCETPLQSARARLQRQAFERVAADADVYFMNMPTGSGKTLCGLKFSLERILRTNKKRLIYIIPYNSIIDQTAAVFEEVLGDSAAILRHQSTYLYDDDAKLSDEEKLARLKATENWDAPVVITTAVQFFESLYGNRRSRLRKLHNLQDAVLVFDEAHLLPREYLQPCLKAIAYCAKYLRSEAVLLTATMPDYAALLERYGAPGLRYVDLIPNRSDFGLFRKCRYASLGAISDEAVLLRGASAPSCLVIVNSRKTARALYAACPARRKYHLSTWMTAIDRKRVIDEIRAALADMERRYPALENVPEGERIFVVSTSLIEAGVDFDFHTVLREMTGLDSILQAGGRCNREGRRAMADVFIFEREESAGKPERDARVNITRDLLHSFDPIDSPECIREYYARVFAAHEDELTRHSIVTFAKAEGCYDPKNPTRLPFRSYSRAFQLIDGKARSIAVPRDELSRELIRRLPFGLPLKELRRLQQYTCSVSLWDYKKLAELKMVDESDGLCWLKNEADYDAETGLRFEGQDIYLD